MQGNFSEAFAAHPFGPVLYLIFTLSAFACLYGFVRKKRFDTGSDACNWSIGALIFLFIGYGIYRMSNTQVLPFYEKTIWSQSAR